MTIPQGYKQTELGIIPEDWEVKKICEGLADVKSGKRLPSGYYVTNQHTKHPYIRVIDMYDGGVDTSNLMYVPDEAYKPIEKYRIFKDDIFISVAGTLGIVGKIPEWLDGANLTENANRLTNITCYRDYLLYYLRSPYIQDVISSEQTIGAQPKLALMRIRNFDIALPKDVAEQRAIAEALSDVDGLIAALDKKVAKKRLLKQGAMQQLLTGKKRLPGFTDKCVEKKLGDVGSLHNGYAFKSETYSQVGKYKVITIANVQNGRLDTNDCNKVSTIPSDMQKHQILKEGDILISMTGNVGRACLVTTIDCLLNQRVGLFAIRDNSQCDESFIYTIINSKEFETAMIDSGQGAAQSNIGKKDIEGYTFLLPNDIKEQQAIATILSDMDKEIADLEAQRDKYRLLKSGMMQKLLTGQIRLKTK